MLKAISNFFVNMSKCIEISRIAEHDLERAGKMMREEIL